MHMLNPDIKQRTMCPPQEASFFSVSGLFFSPVLELFASSGECGWNVFRNHECPFGVHLSFVS